jgi:hypothetical protein
VENYVETFARIEPHAAIKARSFANVLFHQHFKNHIMSSTLLNVLKSSSRGYANHGWLKSHHTFSFANYYNPQYMNYGALRVINEDRVTPDEGFPKHPHSNYEIYSYVVAGEMQHKDSMGNVETIRRGDVQFTSAGTGIAHSEFNVHPTDTLHFLQIWVKPDENGLKPSYATRHYPDQEKTNVLRAIVAPNGDKLDCIKIHQDVTTYASILEKNKTINYTLDPKRKALLQVITTHPNVGVKVTSGNETVQLQAGDVLFVSESTSAANITIEGDSDTPTEFVFFDIGK